MKDIRVLPLFHAYILRDSVVLSALTLNGPSSIMAPVPKEEQPGPAMIQIFFNFLNTNHVKFDKMLPPDSQSTRGLVEELTGDSAR
ncbi:hypothetical protein Hanom_Chr03g00226411 [Helianthus anomalus]